MVSSFLEDTHPRMTRERKNGSSQFSAYSYGQWSASFLQTMISYWKHHKSIVGALQYVTMTRPNIASSNNSPFMHSLLATRFKVAKRILRYLKGIKDYGLILKYSKHLSFMGFCNADPGSDSNNQAIMTCYCIFVWSNAVKDLKETAHHLTL